MSPALATGELLGGAGVLRPAPRHGPAPLLAALGPHTLAGPQLEQQPRHVGVVLQQLACLCGLLLQAEPRGLGDLIETLQRLQILGGEVARQPRGLQRHADIGGGVGLLLVPALGRGGDGGGAQLLLGQGGAGEEAGVLATHGLLAIHLLAALLLEALPRAALLLATIHSVWSPHQAPDMVKCPPEYLAKRSQLFDHRLQGSAIDRN